MEDLRREALANSKPTPGSHYDKNWRVVVDDPVVYQEELKKEQRAIDQKLAKPEKLQVKERQELETRRSWIRDFLEGAKKTVIRAGEVVVEGGKRLKETGTRIGKR